VRDAQHLFKRRDENFSVAICPVFALDEIASITAFRHFAFDRDFDLELGQEVRESLSALGVQA